MKKAIPVIAVALVTATAVQAQETQRGVKLGIKLSPNLGWIHSDTKELEGDGIRLGFSFGLLTDFRLGNNNYALSTGLFLDMAGANQRSKEFTFNQDINGVNVPRTVPALSFARKFQFIELPVLIKLRTNEIGYMTYFGQLGFGSGYNISSKGDEYTMGTDGNIAREDKANISDQTAIFRASLIVGLGAEYNISGNTSILVGLNYNHGFTDAFNKGQLFQVDGGNKVETHGKQHYAELVLGVYF